MLIYSVDDEFAAALIRAHLTSGTPEQAPPLEAEELTELGFHTDIGVPVPSEALSTKIRLMM